MEKIRCKMDTDGNDLVSILAEASPSGFEAFLEH
jgi:hypothetical protein